MTTSVPDRPDSEFLEWKIATLDGVREHGEGYAVELWMYKGRLVIRAYNEASYNDTNVDLFDLLEWAKTGFGSGALLVDKGDKDAAGTRFDLCRD